MADATDSKQVDREFINTLSGDVLSVFRINLIVITLFLTVLGLMTREASIDYVLRAGSSTYTNVGFQFLIGSLLASAYLYFRIRQVGTKEEYPDNGVLNDERILSYSVAASVLGSAFGVISLLAGALDGLGEGGVPLVQSLALFFPIWLISVLFLILTLPDLVVRGRRRVRHWWSG